MHSRRLSLPVSALATLVSRACVNLVTLHFGNRVGHRLLALLYTERRNDYLAKCGGVRLQRNSQSCSAGNVDLLRHKADEREHQRATGIGYAETEVTVGIGVGTSRGTLQKNVDTRQRLPVFFACDLAGDNDIRNNIGCLFDSLNIRVVKGRTYSAGFVRRFGARQAWAGR